ncbi:sodium:proton antiporter NhaD [Thiopseudomonas acetoxidans]|uniref:Sodium:proton antiporter NhaD n=1 Tax=Thiopseudomonas acetoxidans TaxID=3041622 RepID=A0ABT7SQ63_9GAMM|nr:sodium:proton antiporter NhaD [Thiopseudomonas sp. CY1220]MDM7858331.1 sodium:proton antiporter NhaD [Thiopseudomonas sp. CY1220]
MLRSLFMFVAALLSAPAFAAESLETVPHLNATSTLAGYLAVFVFAIAYLVVVAEEKLQLRKSKPVLIGAGIIWVLVGIVSTDPSATKAAFSANFLDFSELMLFLLVAMTYISAMEERRVFEALRAWMVRKGFSYQTLFWVTGILAFFISPVADNLTTALLMCAVVLKVAEGQDRFIAMCCINIVVAANAGGAFSPFGDITTLMVWQAGKVEFLEFFDLFLPAVVNFVVPALVMSFFIPKGKPASISEKVETKRGAKRVMALFLLTIVTAVCGHQFLGLPPVFGMMVGLGYLQFFGYFLRMSLPSSLAKKRTIAEQKADQEKLRYLGSVVPFDIFKNVARAEWDTLLFFYGVVMCVGGLGYLGYLQLVSVMLFDGVGATWAAFGIGVISAVVDNIPVMFAVLEMNPVISHGHWLLVTLAAGVGGSLLSVGSASGVALMGAARGHYTFMSHLRWMPVIFLGYVASMLVHLWLGDILGVFDIYG